MKDILWLGNTHNEVREYSADVRQDIGYNLDKIQRGLEPSDYKPIISVGGGVKEIRIHRENDYRVLYVAKFEEAIYILHIFIKKTQQISLKDITIAKKSYMEMVALRRIKE